VYTIRAAVPEDAAAIAHIHVDSWRTTYAGIVPDDHLAHLSVESRTQMWQQAIAAPNPTPFVLVAEDVARDASGHLVGFVSGGPKRSPADAFDGEIYALYLLRAHQGRGVGRQLLHRAVEHMRQHAMRSMLTWVLADNPACGFYAALGGQPVAEKAITIGGKPLREVAYGWPNIANLRQA